MDHIMLNTIMDEVRAVREVESFNRIPISPHTASYLYAALYSKALRISIHPSPINVTHFRGKRTLLNLIWVKVTSKNLTVSSCSQCVYNLTIISFAHLLGVHLPACYSAFATLICEQRKLMSEPVIPIIPWSYLCMSGVFMHVMCHLLALATRRVLLFLYLWCQ